MKLLKKLLCVMLDHANNITVLHRDDEGAYTIRYDKCSRCGKVLPRGYPAHKKLNNNERTTNVRKS